jgi:fumarate hydratase subunit beta
MAKRILLPLTDDTLEGLRAGDDVLLSGTMYVGRDSAHKRILEAMDQGKPLPFDIRGQTIYYMGPSPGDGPM